MVAQAPDLIVTNGRIYTVDENRPVVDAMSIRDGKVVAVGPARLILASKGTGTQVLDLSGRTVIPGMIDAHAHLLNLGTSLRNVDLVGTSSCEEVIQRVVARAREVQPGTRRRSWPRAWAESPFTKRRFGKGKREG